MSMIWFYFKIILVVDLITDPKLKFEHEQKKMNFYKKKYKYILSLLIKTYIFNRSFHKY